MPAEGEGNRGLQFAVAWLGAIATLLAMLALIVVPVAAILSTSWVMIALYLAIAAGGAFLLAAVIRIVRG